MKLRGGFDLGNSGCKLVIDGKPLFVAMIVKEVPATYERKRLSSTEKTQNTLDVVIRCPHVPELHEKRFFVGQVAKGNGEMVIDPQTKKSKNPYVLIPWLTGVALQAKQSKEEIYASGYAGLPMEEYLVATFKKEYQDRLNGTFEVEFVSTANRVGWKVTLHISVDVKPESLAVIFRQERKNQGRWKPQRQAGLDIGSFSTDISTLDKNLEPIPELCTGIQIGTASAMEDIKQTLNKEYRINLTRDMVDELVTKQNGILELGVKEFDVSEIVAEHCKPYVTQIEKKIMDIIEHPKGAQIARFFSFGGGSKLYKPYLTQLEKRCYAEFVWLDGKIENPADPSQVLEEAIYENAFAFYLLAQM